MAPLRYLIAFQKGRLGQEGREDISREKKSGRKCRERNLDGLESHKVKGSQGAEPYPTSVLAPYLSIIFVFIHQTGCKNKEIDYNRLKEKTTKTYLCFAPVQESLN